MNHKLPFALLMLILLAACGANPATTATALPATPITLPATATALPVTVAALDETPRWGRSR